METSIKYPLSYRLGGLDSDVTFSDEINCYADDANVMSVGTIKRGDYDYVEFYNFAHSIPANSDINSVNVEVEWRVLSTASVLTFTAQVYKAAAAQGNPITDATEPTSMQTDDTSDTGTWLDTELNLNTTSGLLVRLGFAQGTTNTDGDFEVNYVKVTVNYTESAPVYTRGDSGWYSANYLHRKKITIDHTKVDADLSNYPVKVLLTSSNFDFTKSRSDGYDIIFTGSDGETLLTFERAYHDETNSISEHYIKIASVSSSSDTEFYMYYDYSGGSSDLTDHENVWETDFVLVMHMDDDINDSTSNNNDGTNTGTTVSNETTGKWRDFGGYVDMDRITVANSSELTAEDYFTISIMHNQDTLGASGNYRFALLDDLGTANDNMAYRSNVQTDGINSNNVITQDGLNSNADSLLETTTFSIDTEYYSAMKNDGTNLKAFSNLTSSSTSSTKTIYDSTANLQIGCRRDLSDTSYKYHFDGLLKELRISKSARADSWLKADYYDQIALSLSSLGSEEENGGNNNGFFVLVA